MKKTFISAAAILAFTAAGHADELTDIQAQAKQLRDQNAAMTKRLADLEKRQKALEAQKPVAINPVDAMAAEWVHAYGLDMHRRPCGCTCGGCTCPPPQPLTEQQKTQLRRALLALTPPPRPCPPCGWPA